MMPLFLEECNGCLALEERVFVDSWSGKELCAACLSTIINNVTNSPCSEGDNLFQLMYDNDMMEDDEAEENGILVESDS